MSEASKAKGNELAYPHTEFDLNGRIYGEHAGFSKREEMSKDLLCALVTKYSINKSDDQGTLVAMALELTDKLLEALS